MAVKINIKGDKDTNEYKDALVLKQIFENDFSKSDTSGEILIISGATLFGQEVKDIDLIVLGNFDKYSCKIKTKAETGSYQNKEELEMKERLVFVNSFCFVIETKRHRAEDIQLNGIQLLVKYNEKLHDVTTQSEKQKYSLSSFIKDRINFSPYVCNFIWFRNINWDSIKQLLGNNENSLTKHNYLPNSFNLPFLLQLACVQATPYNPKDKDGKLKGYASFKCLKKDQSFDINEMSSIFELFNKVKQGVGQLTRKKIEQITSKLLDNQQYAQAIGEKFIIISGRAGTGKTIKLLRIACDLAYTKGARCLILTYNHALVSDIKRTLALAEIPDGVDTYTVNITTLHKFFFELLIGFGVVKNEMNPDTDVKYIPEYLAKYNEYLKELYEYIDTGLIQDKEIQDLMRSRHDKVAWDYILIDESQDWGEFEKSIIFRIFGKEKVIIADGVDQLVRTQKKCNWVSGLKPDIDFKKTNEKKGLRQEVNLVSFINSYANQLGIIWELEPKPELIGGKIIISLKDYSKELHEREVKRCKEFGNSEYEMMFLVPPNLVTKTHGENGESKNFKLHSEFKQMGINIWDSTSKDIRSQYVVDLTQHRLLQYESCRGLEGWTVICLHLDEFIRYKMETFIEQETNELALGTFEEKRDNFVYLWSLIPLTRAIDTLIITLKDKDSKVGKALRKVYEQNPDFVQWIE
jgi:hypothetical protein